MKVMIEAWVRVKVRATCTKEPPIRSETAGVRKGNGGSRLARAEAVCGREPWVRVRVRMGVGVGVRARVVLCWWE